MNVIASIQARMASSRLPGKVLKEICGKPMLWWQIERLKVSRLLDDVIVATTLNPADDTIVEFCQKYKVKYYRGSEHDVLNRIASLIRECKVDVHVECFGDSPLVDPRVIDAIVGFYLKHQKQYDFVSNSIRTTYPPGQEVLVYRGTALIEADGFVKADDPLREHVSIHITQHKEKFKLFNIEAPPRYHHPDIYLEVDTPEDLELMTNIITHFKNKGEEVFSLKQILDYLACRKDLIEINRRVTRRWKQFRA